MAIIESAATRTSFTVCVCVCVFAHKAQNHRQCLCVCVRQAVFASMELGQSPVFIGNFETFSKYIFVQF